MITSAPAAVIEGLYCKRSFPDLRCQFSRKGYPFPFEKISTAENQELLPGSQHPAICAI